MEDVAVNFRKNRDLLVLKLKEILLLIENNETPISGDDRTKLMANFEEIDSLVKKYDQSALSLFSKN
ncbi:MAG: hypothetical protein WCK31_04865 [bacterium]